MARTRKSRPKAKTARATGARKMPPASRKRATKPKSSKAPPTKPAIFPLDGFVEAAARVLALPVEPEWRAAIKANLEVNLRLAAFVAEFALPDETEPAPVFTA
jgi:hypothetical protein